MINWTRTEFAALSVNESYARSVAASFVSHLDPTVEEIIEIKTAVSEAVSNSIIHAYDGGGCGKTVVMECSYDDKGVVTIVISDTGKGIENVEEAMKPLFTTGSSEERSGMGFTVMESFMDKVIVESVPGEGTRVTMKKSLDIAYGL